jgi:hypothetical protein
MTDINDLIGKPWRLGARGPDAYDCWGLVREVLQRMRPGLPLPDWASDEMTRSRQRALMGEAFPVHCVRTTELADGVLLMSERAGHIAIMAHGFAVTSQRFSGVVAMRPSDYATHFTDLEAFAWRT